MAASPSSMPPWIVQRLETSFPTELEWHSGMTFVFLLSGELRIQVGARRYHMRTNDFLFFKPYEIFCSLQNPLPYRALVVTVERRLIHQVCPEFDGLNFDIQLLRYNLSDGLYQSICAQLAVIIFTTTKADICSDLKLLTCCSTILTLLIEALGVENSLDDRPSRNHARERVFTVLQYINENYAESITLETLAAHIGLHPQYFSAFFKKQLGATFSEYLGRYRATQSLPALLHTDEHILDIAVSNGFNSHKTYATAFQKAYGLLPSEYRRQHRLQSAPGSEKEFAQETEGFFHFFQKYWSTDDSAGSRIPSAKTQQAIAFNEETAHRTAFTNQTLNFISVGRAYSCLRSDIQLQLRKAKIDLHLDYVRIRDIFSDDLLVYYEDADKNPVFGWQSIDIALDFLLSIGVKPFAEIGYMPNQMASKKQFAGWQYHPNVSCPKSYQLWALLVTSFFEHCINRYGAQEVHSWYFDFWTNPNMSLVNGFWNESQAEFFKFYRVTYNAVKRVDPKIQLGSPNFSYPTGMPWYESFFVYAGSHGLHPDFISIHSYACGDGQVDKNANFLRYNIHEETATYSPVSPQKDYIREQIDDLRACCGRYGLAGLDIIVSDWNITYLPKDYTRDTCFLGAYILYSYCRAANHVKGLCFWSLSDIHEDFFCSDVVFHGGPGLMDYRGLPKASYHAMAMAYSLSKQILQAGENYILAKTEHGYQMILFNLDFYDALYRIPDTSALTYTQRYNVYETIHSIDFHMAFSVAAGTYAITKRRINRDSGSSYDLWLKMGSPKDFRGELSQYLQAHCIPDIYCETVSTNPTLTFDELVEPHGMVFISMEKLDLLQKKD